MSFEEKILWSEGLSIGNRKVDNDHKKLINAYNALVDLVASNGTREEFAGILSEMTDYVLLHFNKEEKYMEAFNYPDFEAHKQFNMEYIYKVSMYNIEFSFFRSTDPRDVLRYLEHWWVNHILESDIAYEQYKRSIKSGVCYSEF